MLTEVMGIWLKRLGETVGKGFYEIEEQKLEALVVVTVLQALEDKSEQAVQLLEDYWRSTLYDDY